VPFLAGNRAEAVVDELAALSATEASSVAVAATVAPWKAWEARDLEIGEPERWVEGDDREPLPAKQGSRFHNETWLPGCRGSPGGRSWRGLGSG
jgi:hypothetical protein